MASTSAGPVRLAWADIDTGDLDGVVDGTRRAASNRPSVLRAAVAELAGSLRVVLETAGLPVADSEEARDVLAAVQRAGAVIGRADTVLVEHGRSPSRLDATRQELLSVAAGILRPSTDRAAHHLPVLPTVVPGPAGELPGGMVGCDIEGNRELRTLRWYPDGGGDPLLAVVAGRARPSEGWRYDLADRAGWVALAHDVLVVVCGYRNHAPALPPLLAEHASNWLGSELMRRYRTGSWAIRAIDVLLTLTQAGFITVLETPPTRT